MAFGLSPNYVQDLRLKDLDKSHFLILSLEAASALGWNVSFVSETGFIAYTKVSWSSWSEEVTVKVSDNRAYIKSACTGAQLMDWGKNKKNVRRLLSKIKEVRELLTEEDLASRLAELKAGIASNDEEDILSQPPSTTKDKITGFLSVFVPTKGYFVSPILINTNILIFIAMALTGVHIIVPEYNDLLNWGANFRPMTLEGQWWRLFTACFVHIGILHLLFNMYALFYIGLLLEPYLGKARFLAAYLMSGIAASMASLWWHDFTISAGASGAIFGMYGVFLALLTTNLLDKSVKKALMASILVFVGYNILNGLKPDSGIDNAAHIGGLVSGLLIGYAFVPSLKQFENERLKRSTIGILAAVLFVSSFTLYSALPNDIGTYDKEMERFFAMESLALEIYNLPPYTPAEEILSEIKDKGLYYWNENIKILDSFHDLDLPLSVKERNEKLRTYCELRIKNYELIYKTIEEGTDQYEEEIEDLGYQIERLIDELTNDF